MSQLPASLPFNIEVSGEVSVDFTYRHPG